MATISDRLKSLRNKKKLSQNDLALSLGIKIAKAVVCGLKEKNSESFTLK